jgi:hypothetical protein
MSRVGYVERRAEVIDVGHGVVVVSCPTVRPGGVLRRLYLPSGDEVAEAVAWAEATAAACDVEWARGAN